MEIKYPDVHVPLVGEDGNAFAIIGRVRTALRREVDGEAAAAFTAEATACSSYDELLRLVSVTVTEGYEEGW